MTSRTNVATNELSSACRARRTGSAGPRRRSDRRSAPPHGSAVRRRVAFPSVGAGGAGVDGVGVDDPLRASRSTHDVSDRRSKADIVILDDLRGAAIAPAQWMRASESSQSRTRSAHCARPTGTTAWSVMASRRLGCATQKAVAPGDDHPHGRTPRAGPSFAAGRATSRWSALCPIDRCSSEV